MTDANKDATSRKTFDFTEIFTMSSEAIATVIKMIESLPETAQERVVDHLREYITELQDELEWDSL